MRSNDKHRERALVWPNLKSCTENVEHQVNIIIFRVINSDDDVIPLPIFPYSLRFNTEAYINCRRRQCCLGGRGRILEVSLSEQQDCAAYHTSKRTQSWQLDNTRDYITAIIWPPNYPGGTFLDYQA